MHFLPHMVTGTHAKVKVHVKVSQKQTTEGESNVMHSAVQLKKIQTLMSTALLPMPIASTNTNTNADAMIAASYGC